MSVWRNWIARPTSNREAVGSSPITDTIHHSSDGRATDCSGFNSMNYS